MDSNNTVCSAGPTLWVMRCPECKRRMAFTNCGGNFVGYCEACDEWQQA
mgnify:CR=1 FL=1